MASAPVTLASAQASTTKVLRGFCDEQRRRADALHPLYGRLWQAIGQQLQAGGKRLRPYIVLLSYEAFGGRQKSEAIQVAAAWELLHVSLLMHDDIIDRDYTRHGLPNVAGIYKTYYADLDEVTQAHYAQSAALLAGDLLLTAAHEWILDSSFSSGIRTRASELMQDAVFQVIGGELLDSEAAAPRQPIDPIVIAETKTASYSLIGPLLTGACLAGADGGHIEVLLRELGRLLGTGYQLVDDVLGVFGDEAQTGKSVSSDLAEGKRSLVVCMGLELMNKKDRMQAEMWLDQGDESFAEKLRDLLERTPLRERIKTELLKYEESALDIIDKLALPKVYAEAFRELVALLLVRRS